MSGFLTQYSTIASAPISGSGSVGSNLYTASSVNSARTSSASLLSHALRYPSTHFQPLRCSWFRSSRHGCHPLLHRPVATRPQSQEKSSSDQGFFNVGGAGSGWITWIRPRHRSSRRKPCSQGSPTPGWMRSPTTSSSPHWSASRTPGVSSTRHACGLLPRRSAGPTRPSVKSRSPRRAGHRKPQHWLESLTGAAPREIDRRLRLGRLVIERPMFDGFLAPPVFPAVAGAMRAGRIGVDTAETITRHLQQAARRHARIEDVEAAERILVDESAGLPFWEVDLHAKVWREALDPDGAKPREEALRQARSFTLGRERNGMTPFWGEAPPDRGRAASRRVRGGDSARTRRPGSSTLTRSSRAPTLALRVRSASTCSIGFFRAGSPRPDGAALDRDRAGHRDAERPYERARRCLARRCCRTDLRLCRAGAGLRERFTDRSWSASMASLSRTGSNSDTRHRRSEERSRYGTADASSASCTAPPSWTDAHHVIPYSCDGPTDLDNLVLLCPGPPHRGAPGQIRDPHGEWPP